MIFFNANDQSQKWGTKIIVSDKTVLKLNLCPTKLLSKKKIKLHFDYTILNISCLKTCACTLPQQSLSTASLPHSINYKKNFSDKSDKNLRYKNQRYFNIVLFVILNINYLRITLRFPFLNHSFKNFCKEI